MDEAEDELTMGPVMKVPGIVIGILAHSCPARSARFSRDVLLSKGVISLPDVMVGAAVARVKHAATNTNEGKKREKWTMIGGFEELDAIVENECKVC